jgi:UDP-N-acetylmuramate--alanine ligase
MDSILQGVKTIHFVGIGGIGVSGLALLLKEQGFIVRGSDSKESPATQLLRDNGIEVFIGHADSYVKADTDLLAYSSAIRQDNPEMQTALARGIKTVKRGQLLGEVCEDKKTIAIAGSHGKTTTTSMTAFLLDTLGLNPTFFVGGIPLNYAHARNAVTGSDYFAIETDESDGSFLYYKPWVSIITNVDKEHMDHYADLSELHLSFMQFAMQTKEKVIGCGDDPCVRNILDKVSGISYGFGEHNRMRAMNSYFDGKFNHFDYYDDSQKIVSVKVPLLGVHNILNSLAVLSFIKYAGFDVERAAKALADFRGTKRRFQVKCQVGGVMFVDDYGHHPTEIAAVLKAARQLNPKRVVALFQPHRYSRVKSLQEEFSRCFTSADEVIITDIYAASESPIIGVNSESLCKSIQTFVHGAVRYVPKDDLISQVPGYLREGDICIALGAGDINVIAEEIANEFKKRSGK